MFHFVILAMAAQAAASPGPTQTPDVEDGNGLLAMCSSEGAYYRLGVCDGYILGAANVGLVAKLFCSPNGVTKGQIRDIVVSGLRNDPVNRHQGSVSLVIKYLSAAYPCHQ